jgi:hypothetical protein
MACIKVRPDSPAIDQRMPHLQSCMTVASADLRQWHGMSRHRPAWWSSQQPDHGTHPAEQLMASNQPPQVAVRASRTLGRRGARMAAALYMVAAARRTLCHTSHNAVLNAVPGGSLGGEGGALAAPGPLLTRCWCHLAASVPATTRAASRQHACHGMTRSLLRFEGAGLLGRAPPAGGSRLPVSRCQLVDSAWHHALVITLTTAGWP